MKERSLFAIHDPVGVKLLSRLRLKFSHLNEHEFRHKFKYAPSPMFFQGVFFLFLSKNCKYYNYFVFYWPTSTVILINICFSSSSVNAKNNCAPPSHVCDF